MKRAAPELFYREVRRMMKKMMNGGMKTTGAAR
jgi:hypothetical protein